MKLASDKEAASKAIDEIKAFRAALKVIGIDPGVHTGVALYDRGSKKVEEAKTLDFWSALDFVCTFSKNEIAVVIEDPNLNRPTFLKHGQEGREKISQNVGSNKAEARLLIDGLRKMGYVVRTEKPMSSKWTAEQVKRHTGYEARCSEHARDAIKLCFKA